MDKKKAEIELARKMMQEGIEGEGDMLSRISTTMRKQARDRFKEGLKRYEKSDEKIREKEAYDFAGYKKGGKVKKMAGGGATLPPYIPKSVAPIAPKQYDETTMSKSDVGKIADQQRAMAAAKYPTQPSRFPTTQPVSSTSAPKLKPTLMQKPTAPARGPRPIPTMKSGGKVSSASKRADGCATKGKTRGRMV